jgi:hypothetical protein
MMKMPVDSTFYVDTHGHVILILFAAPTQRYVSTECWHADT